MERPFYFRHFTLEQGACAMRLSTDALFLGAWATQDLVPAPRHILDVGTGTGVLALMMAQHYTDAEICAIDIDDNAIRTAQLNFDHTPWRDRLTAQACDITATAIQLQAHQYDFIISNPPYFCGIKPSTMALGQARHTSYGFAPEHLFHYLENFVTESPTICLITPIETLSLIRRAAVIHRYNLTRICWLHHHDSHPAIRVLTQWHRSQTTPPSCRSERLVVRTATQKYTPEASVLLRPYLLDTYLF